MCHSGEREPVAPQRTGGVLEGGDPWSGPCCAKPLSCPTITAPCVTLMLCPGDGTGLSTHRTVHTDVGSHGATRHILLGNYFSPCPPATGLSLQPAPVPVPVPVPIPIPGTVHAVTQHFNSSGVCRACSPSPPSPLTLPLSRSGLGDPVPVPGVGTAGSPSPPTRHLSYLYQKEQRFIFVVCTGGSGDRRFIFKE